MLVLVELFSSLAFFNQIFILEIELVGGSGPHEGNILVRGEPVCDDDPRPYNAQVVCRYKNTFSVKMLTTQDQ